MESITEFFHMGGHGAFIWPSYGIVALVLVGLFVAGRRYQRNTEAELTSLNPRSRRRASAPMDTQTEETGNETQT